MCEVTYLYVSCHKSSHEVTVRWHEMERTYSIRDMTHLYMLCGSFIYATWLIYVCHATVISWGDCEMTWDGENILYTWLTRRTIQPMHASSRPLYILYVNKFRTLYTNPVSYGVATSSRLLKIIGLFGEYRSLL